MERVRSLLHTRVGSVLAALRREPRSCFLGLDVSLSRTGLAVVDGAGTLLHVSSSKPPYSQRSSFLASATCLSTSIGALSQDYSIVATLVEDFLQTFEANSSSSHTRFTLARVNGIAAYEAWRQTCGPVIFAYPTSMRSYFEIERAPAPGGGGKGGKGKGRGGGPGEGPGGADQDPSLATTAARARVASRARGKWAVKEFAQSIHGGLEGMKDDEVDAILAAMYCLTQEVEWRVLRGVDVPSKAAGGDGGSSNSSSSTDCVFEALLDAKLPSARLGKVGVAKGVTPLEVVRGALVLTHKGALNGEAAKRGCRDETGGEQDVEGRGEGEGGLPPSLLPATAKRKPKGKAGKGESGGPVGGAGTTGIDPTDLLRLYKRQRATLTQEIKQVLLGKVGEGGGLLPWGRTKPSSSSSSLLPPA